MQQGNDSYRLIVRRGPQPNQIYELTEETVNLGRDITNNIVINDREVSRHHLRFTRGPDGVTIEDLGSTNGTFINGRRLTGATSLKNGDMIGLGETVTLGYEVLRGGMGAPAPQAPAAAPYQPPAAATPPAPAASPYQPPAAAPQPDPYQAPPPAYAPPSAQPAPAAGYAAPAPQPAYQGQQADPYQQQQGYPAPDPYQSYSPPPPPGYGYDQHDPFGMREEEGSNTTRFILIGCVVLMIMCCCCTLVGFVAVDMLCLYDKLPVLPSILRALGVVVQCGS